MQQQRVAFWQLMHGLLARDLIFIDESCMNLTSPGYLHAHLKVKENESPQKRDQNVSLIGAIGLRGLMAQVSLLGATNDLTFEAFIAHRLVPKL